MHIKILEKRIEELQGNVNKMKADLDKYSKYWSQHHVKRVKEAASAVEKHTQTLRDAIKSVQD